MYNPLTMLKTYLDKRRKLKNDMQLFLSSGVVRHGTTEISYFVEYGKVDRNNRSTKVKIKVSQEN